MPQTVLYRPQDLILELDTHRAYRPGDVISGKVKVRPSAEYSQSSIRYLRVTLWGRSKTKIVRHNGNNRRVYRGRALFFDKQIPLTKADEPDPDVNVKQSWRFEGLIPASPDRHLGGDEWDAEGPFLSSRGDLSNHSLPSTFYYDGTYGLSPTSKEAFIEYVLAAELHLSKPGKDHKVCKRTATIPMMIEKPGTDTPTADFQPRDRSSMIVTKSLQLLPDKQNTSLTFRERMRTTFQPSKIPQYAFNLVVQYPTVVQLNNPHLPFHLRIEPRTDQTFTSIRPTEYPGVKITSFSLTVESQTHFRVQSSFMGTHNANKSDRYTVYDSSQRATGAEEVAMTLPSDPARSFDMSAHLGLMVQRTYVSILRSDPGRAQSSPPAYSADTTRLGAGPAPESSLPAYSSTTSGHFDRPLYPTFSTYNIAQTHTLCWKLKLVVTGTEVTKTVRGRAAVTVIGESGHQPARGDLEIDEKAVASSGNKATILEENREQIL